MIQSLVNRLLWKSKRDTRYDSTLYNSYNAIPDYADAFRNATRFTRSLGFTYEDLPLNHVPLIDPDGNAVASAVANAGITDLRHSAAQCLKWCHWLAPHFENELKSTVHITIGQLWHNGSPVFEPSWTDLKRWVENGISIQDLMPTGLKAHAWLTASSGEIIEPTLLSSLASVNGGTFESLAGRIAWGFDPNAVSNHRYFPMLIGQQTIACIGKRSALPLLANRPEQLYELPVGIAFD